MTKSVHLGFTVGAGEPVEVPVRHMVVTGQTQEAGKTTTLEALIRRSELPAIAFLTKRGEGSLAGRKILPYFRERADWQFVQSILESTMRKDQTFKQPWIIRACEGARTLADVQRRVAELEDSTRNALSKDMYMVLGEYLKRVVPLIASLPKAHDVGIFPGLAVMDLTAYPEELKMLVIASTLEWIHKNANGVITVIPEAWKFIPEAKNTPVKVVAEKLAREGAALKNFIWIDSQDIAGVAKLLLRGCSVWLIGVQREANEIKRALDNMPANMNRPKAGDVATLELGQFFACHGHELRKVYVQPVWMDPAHARKVAQGRMKAYELARVRPAFQPGPGETEVRFQCSCGKPVSAESGSDADTARKCLDCVEDAMWKEKFEAEQARADALQNQVHQLNQEVAALRKNLDAAGNAVAMLSITKEQPGWQPGTVVGEAPLEGPADAPAPPERHLHPLSPFLAPILPEAISSVTRAVIEQLRRDPVLIRLALEKPAMEVKITQKVISINGSTVKGKMARLIHEGWFKERRSQAEIRAELIRRGMGPNTGGGFTDPLNQLVQEGFLYRAGADMYELAPDAEVRVVNS